MKRGDDLRPGGLDDRVHVREVLVERTAAGGSEAIFGSRHAAVERLVAVDIAGLFELSRVDAEIAVRRAEQALQFVERELRVDSERAHDAESKTFVDQPIECERRSFLRCLRSAGRGLLMKS